MAAINATYTFTPAVTGGAVSVSGETESQIKANVLAVLAARKTQQAATVAALDQAETGMNG